MVAVVCLYVAKVPHTVQSRWPKVMVVPDIEQCVNAVQACVSLLCVYVWGVYPFAREEHNDLLLGSNTLPDGFYIIVIVVCFVAEVPVADSTEPGSLWSHDLGVGEAVYGNVVHWVVWFLWCVP